VVTLGTDGADSDIFPNLRFKLNNKSESESISKLVRDANASPFCEQQTDNNKTKVATTRHAIVMHGFLAPTLPYPFSSLLFSSIFGIYTLIHTCL